MCTRFLAQKLNKAAQSLAISPADAEGVNVSQTVMVTEPVLGDDARPWMYSFAQWIQNMPQIEHFLVNKMNMQVEEDTDTEENGE